MYARLQYIIMMILVYVCQATVHYDDDASVKYLAVLLYILVPLATACAFVNYVEIVDKILSAAKIPQIYFT